MAEPVDLLKAAREVAQQFANVASAFAGQSIQEGRELLGPLQRQADLVEQVLRRQVEFEQQLVGRMFGPAQATAEALDKAPEAMRAQAAAFRAAAASFGQVADLLEVQAGALEQTLRILKTPMKMAGMGIGLAQRRPSRG